MSNLLLPTRFDLSKTYYLSGPMTGYSDFNYPAFESAITALRSNNINMLSPHENPWPEKHLLLDEISLWNTMMEVAMKQVNQCSGIILLRGWPQSRGAVRELQASLVAGYSVYFLADSILIDMNREN